jgi:hypothetical protein
MPPQNLNPGDRVVELAAVVTTAAIVSGAIVSAAVVWIIKKSWLASVGAFFSGAVVGFILAQFVGRLLYKTAGGNTTVVKVGGAGLSATIPAGLAGSISTAVVIALIALLVFSAKSQALNLFGVAIGCGLILGILFACLSSLL